MSVREIALKAAEELPVLLSEEFKTADRIKAAIREAAKPLVGALKRVAEMQSTAEHDVAYFVAREALAVWRDGK